MTEHRLSNAGKGPKTSYWGSVAMWPGRLTALKNNLTIGKHEERPRQESPANRSGSVSQGDRGASPRSERSAPEGPGDTGGAARVVERSAGPRADVRQDPGADRRRAAREGPGGDLPPGERDPGEEPQRPLNPSRRRTAFIFNTNLRAHRSGRPAYAWRGVAASSPINESTQPSIT